MECPVCKSTNVVKPSVAVDQGSSAHVGIGVSSGGVGVGVGSSTTREARKARDLAYKELKENIGADESLTDKVEQISIISTVAVFYYIMFGIIGYNWEGYGDSFFISIFVLLLYCVIPFIAAFLVYYYALEAYIDKLRERGGRWTKTRNKVQYWMCRSCGSTFQR